MVKFAHLKKLEEVMLTKIKYNAFRPPEEKKSLEAESYIYSLQLYISCLCFNFAPVNFCTSLQIYYCTHHPFKKFRYFKNWFHLVHVLEGTVHKR